MKAGEGILHAQMRLFTVIFLILAAFVHQPAMATSLDDRVISEIQFEGLDRVSEQRVLNIIQSVVGEPYLADAVQGDVHTLTHLGEFNYITADVVLQEDGTVHLIYSFREQQIITQVSVVGNTMIDSLVAFQDHFIVSTIKDELNLDRPYALMTFHRPSNVDEYENLKSLVRALKKVSETIDCVFPIHLPGQKTS